MFAGWLLVQNPSQDDLDGLPIDFHLTGGEVSDSTQFKVSLDMGPDITPRAAMTEIGYDSTANRTACRNVASFRSSRTETMPKTGRITFPGCFTKACPHRADPGQAQALQTRRTTLRDNRSQLQRNRRFCLRYNLGQIRPHGLECFSSDRFDRNWGEGQPLLALHCLSVRLGMQGLASSSCNRAGDSPDVGDERPCGCTFGGCLEVFGEPAAPAEPSQRAFYDLTPRQDLEALGRVGAPNDLHRPAAECRQGVFQRVTGVAAVSKDVPSRG